MHYSAGIDMIVMKIVLDITVKVNEECTKKLMKYVAFSPNLLKELRR